MRVSAAALSILLLQAGPLVAYEIDGSKWPGGETMFYTAVEGFSNRLIPWNDAVLSALDEWSSETDFNFVVREEYRSPCANDLINSIDFTEDVCGSSFGSSTIAVTLSEYEESVLGPPRIISADIVVNENKVFEVFDGPLKSFLLGTITNPLDLRRVVLHELGHVIGLGHDDEVDAIMNSTVSDFDRLQQDDIDGTNALYRGLDNCEVLSVTFGSTSGSLQSGDCTVQDLMVGGDDLSFIDVRRLVLSEPTELTIDMRSGSLDSVILLADDNLRILDLDDNGGLDCDAKLSRDLSAGTYYVLSNTYNESSTCAEVFGPYQLSLTFTSATEADLQAGASLLGTQADTMFFGGISADNGHSYSNRFKPSQSLDISARIVVDPGHAGKPGFLVVAALLEGGFLLKNQLGQWIGFDPAQDALTKAAEKTLEAVELISIAENLVTQDLAIEQAAVDFYVGYGLDDQPGELYFHQQPINLLIEP